MGEAPRKDSEKGFVPMSGEGNDFRLFAQRAASTALIGPNPT